MVWLKAIGCRSVAWLIALKMSPGEGSATASTALRHLVDCSSAHKWGAIYVNDPAAGPIKVLVIDDSNTIRRSAEMFLRQAGFEVILAEDGFDALAKISDYHPKVIFVDIMMPRLDGYQTCALIKQNPQFRSTPVIMLSSKDGVFDRARGRLAGSDCYLTKPFTKEGLIQAVTDYARPVVSPPRTIREVHPYADQKDSRR
jgi:twitching motility two-component system response regulator PilG